MLIARRIFTLLNGGFVTFIKRLSLTFWLTTSTTIFGTAAFTWSTTVLVLSPGNATSSRPAWSAAYFVPRSTMTT